MMNSDNNVVYYYSDRYDETSYYEIKEYINKTKNKYRTSVSLDNSAFQLVNHFDEFSDALQFVKKHQFKIDYVKE